MQGVFFNGNRVATKRALRAEVETGNRDAVRLEATSIFGDEYDGPLIDAPDGNYYVVGPDPYTSRKWYAQIKKSGDSCHVI